MVYDLSSEHPPSLPPNSSPKPILDINLKKIDSDIHCVQCGYNLRGLSGRGICPECGKPVLQSLAGELLKHSPIDWLRLVKKGLMLLLISIFLSMAATINVIVDPQLATALEITEALLVFFATLFITTPEPRLPTWPMRIDLRVWLKRVALFRFAVAMMALSALLLGLPAKIMNLALIIGLMLSFVMIYGLSFYLRTFADRIPDYDLERATVQVLWGLGLCLALIVLFTLITAVFLGTRNVGPAPIIVVLGLIGFVYFSARLIALLFRYHSSFKWCIYEAKQEQLA